MSEQHPPVPLGAVGMISRAILGEKLWNSYVDQHPDGWWFHRWEWLDYCLAYKQGQDFSFALVNDRQEVCGVCPVVIEGRQFAMGGNPTVTVIFSEGMLQLHDQIAHHINTIAAMHGVGEGEMMNWITEPKPGLCIPEDILGPCASDASFKRRVIDLSLPEAVRWKQVRKSSHQLIRQADKTLKLNYSEDPAQSLSSFLSMHKDFYGMPRSAATYNFQQSWAELGVAKAYLAYNGYGLQMGGVLWYVYKGIALYASGVYPQDNISHYLLWESMNDLAQQGVKYADLGYQDRAKTVKEEQIEFFKRFAGGEDWPVPCIHRVFLSQRTEGAA